MLPDEAEVWRNLREWKSREKCRCEESMKTRMEKCCVRVGLRQRPFVREWLRICVSYNIVVQWRGRNGPGVEGPLRIQGKRNIGRRDICTERGMKILSVAKYAWNVHEHRKIELCLRKKKISYRRSAFFEIAKRFNTLIHCACIAAVRQVRRMLRRKNNEIEGNFENPFPPPKERIV